MFVKPVMKLLSTILLVICLVVLMLLGMTEYQMKQRLSLDKAQLLTIEPGSSFNKFSKQLVSLGAIDNRFWLRNYVRLHPELSQIKAGTYEVKPGQTVVEILQLLNSGQEYQYKITFIEGTTLLQWLEVLARDPNIEQTIDYSKRWALYQEISRSLSLDKEYPEGLFFPETYAFTKGTTDLDILRRASEKMKVELNKAWNNRFGNLPYATPYEALIMASIIEKESGLFAEHKTIASVFVNRLEKGMRLQTDPTIIYGLGDAYDGDIKRKHKFQKTAYNTYRIDGLPPTPIAMPGKSAIIAALQPDQTEYFYFVSNGEGKHIFSTNLADHNKAVQKYQLSK